MILASRIRTVLLSVALLSVSGRAAADTIVLKNGRRIIALSAVEEGDKIKYLTSAGELSLPKSIVDHIEKGGSVPMAGSPGADAANLDIAPPVMESSGAIAEVEHGAVHEGAIDREYIAKLEGAARSGGRQANRSAALGHHLAANFELSRGDMEHALSDARTALNYAPEEPALLLNVGYLLLRRSEFKESLEYLERARRFAPDNPDVPKLEGWAYYGLNKIAQAVAEWKRAQALRPDKEVQLALDRALADKQEEESYKENESSHFKLRYSGAAAPALAREVLRTLERHFSAIESELNFTPPEPIGVILYTQDAFSDITKAPSWAGALNDSFIAQKTRSACMGLAASCTIHAPAWIQEGLAQWMEGQRSREDAAVLLQIYNDNKAIPLSRHEGSWLNMSGDTARYAYAWAMANIEYIVQADGMGDIERILDRIGAGMATETALRDVLHSGYDDLMQSAAEYLRKTYAR